jgi:hypothetical protein
MSVPRPARTAGMSGAAHRARARGGKGGGWCEKQRDAQREPRQKARGGPLLASVRAAAPLPGAAPGSPLVAASALRPAAPSSASSSSSSSSSVS